MNYPQSQEVLEFIKNSKRILLNCHRNPDSDSLGSSTALAMYLQSLGKEVLILSPSSIPSHIEFLAKDMPIQQVEFDAFDFSKWDLLIMTDTSSWDRVFNSTDKSVTEIPVVVIDNHETNKGFGKINMLDFQTSSVCEQLYKVFEDWNVEITPQMAQSLLSGIEGDSGSFQFEVYERTFEIAQKLITKGANLPLINFHLFNSLSLEIFKFWEIVIRNLKLTEEGIAYATIGIDEYEPFIHVSGCRETAAMMIIRKLENSKFGFIMVEDERGVFSVSFRNREQYDVATIAQALGGGGHPGAAGASVHAENADEATQKVLEACKEALHNK